MVHEEPQLLPIDDLQRPEPLASKSGVATAALAESVDRACLVRIADVLRTAHSFDLARYRDGIVRRQVIRRMRSLGEVDVERYIGLLASSAEEARHL